MLVRQDVESRIEERFAQGKAALPNLSAEGLVEFTTQPGLAPQPPGCVRVPSAGRIGSAGRQSTASPAAVGGGSLGVSFSDDFSDLMETTASGRRIATSKGKLPWDNPPLRKATPNELSRSEPNMSGLGGGGGLIPPGARALPLSRNGRSFQLDTALEEESDEEHVPPSFSAPHSFSPIGRPGRPLGSRQGEAKAASASLNTFANMRIDVPSNANYLQGPSSAPGVTGDPLWRERPDSEEPEEGGVFAVVRASISPPLATTAGGRGSPLVSARGDGSSPSMELSAVSAETQAHTLSP